jgi:hypothetical protein
LHCHAVTLHVELHLRARGEALQTAQRFVAREWGARFQGLCLRLQSQHVGLLLADVRASVVAVAQGVECGGNGDGPEQQHT